MSETDLSEAVVRRVRRPGGLEIPYRIVGSGAGPRMVFAHALTGSGLLTPDEFFAPVLERGWTVIAVDQRGHGAATATRNPAHYRPAPMGEDLLAVLDDAGWASAWLCGASMGTAPAISAAVTHPDRVDGLILLAPPFGRERNAAADAFAGIAEALERDGIEAASVVWRTAMERREVADEAIDAQLVQLRMHDQAGLGVWLREMMAWTIGPELDLLATTDVPVAVVAWEGDDIHPAAVGQRIAAAGPRGACTVVDLTSPDNGPRFLLDAALETVDRLDRT